MPAPHSLIERSRHAFAELVRRCGLETAAVSVRTRALSTEEAIGEPGRRDFPLVKGKERLLEAVVGESRGNAFTDAPREFTGSVDELLAVPLDGARNRGLYIAALNAAFRSAGLVGGTVHCRDDDPERCATEIAATVEGRLRWHRVGLVGFNPAIAEELVRRLGPDRLRITDLDPNNIGTERFGVVIWDGEHRFRDLVEWADGVLMTGSTFVNGTFDALQETVEQAGKPMVLYGVTAAAMAHLFGFERLCPYARD
jgi:Putative heavy-metal chelation